MGNIDQTNAQLLVEIQDLQKRLNQFELIFNSVGNTIWLLDAQFHIQYSNQAAEAMFQKPVVAMIGRHCWEIVHGTDQPIPGCPVVQTSKTGKRESTQLQIGQKWFEVVVDPIFEPSGQITGYTHIVSNITQRKQAEEVLQASEKQLRAVLEASSESVFLMDTQGRLLMANQITAQRLKTDLETLKKENLYNFLPPAVAENRRKHIQDVIETGQPIRFEDERFGRTMLNSVYPIFGKDNQVTHLAVYGMDITEGKKKEEHIRENAERYRNMFQNNHAVLLVIDPENGRILDANPAACKYYGYDLKTIKAKKILDINTLTPEQIFEEMARAKAEKRNHFYFYHRLANGEVRPVEVYSGPIVIKGKQLLYSIVHDISERRKAEEEKERLILELRAAFSKIRVLSGMLPICASCKKIRDDQGYWQQIESYIKEHSEVEFSHGICPGCIEKLYPDLDIK